MDRITIVNHLSVISEKYNSLLQQLRGKKEITNDEFNVIYNMLISDKLYMDSHIYNVIVFELKRLLNIEKNRFTLGNKLYRF